MFKSHHVIHVPAAWEFYCRFGVRFLECAWCEFLLLVWVWHSMVCTVHMFSYTYKISFQIEAYSETWMIKQLNYPHTNLNCQWELLEVGLTDFDCGVAMSSKQSDENFVYCRNLFNLINNCLRYWYNPHFEFVHWFHLLRWMFNCKSSLIKFMTIWCLSNMSLSRCLK
jgi:hypothetical protein